MKTYTRAALITAGVVAVLVLGGVLAAVIYLATSQNTRTASPETSGVAVVRDNSHVLDDAGADAVTVVEFLDFECEACGAFYPIVEDLREQYHGDITYVVRYFPLPGHVNSTNAALAAEAAAQQGRFEDMYRTLFETQAEWGEAGESRASVFRGYAEDMGLDLAAYDAAIADPATQGRVTMDFEEGRALGVGRTPTFFIDGEQLELQQLTDLEDAIAQAVAP